MTPTIQIVVACLAAYNNGILHGEWIDLNQPLDDVWRAICTMLNNSPIPNAEELAIHDYEGFEGYDKVVASPSFLITPFLTAILTFLAWLCPYK
jgi:antirestriction protein